MNAAVRSRYPNALQTALFRINAADGDLWLAQNVQVGEVVSDNGTGPTAGGGIIGLAQVDEVTLRTYRQSTRDDPVASATELLSDSEYLLFLGYFREGGLTDAGNLLFDKHPQATIPGAFVQCTRYFGTSKDADERSTERFAGTVRDQIDAVNRFVERHAKSYQSHGSPQASLRHEYPVRCVRELVANALVHRDYADNTRFVHVRVFDDRVEIASPGTWASRSIEEGTTVTLSTLRGESVRRNPDLALGLARLRYFEGEGSGLYGATEAARLGGAREPTVEMRSGFTVVTIFPSRLPPGTLVNIRSAISQRLDEAIQLARQSDSQQNLVRAVVPLGTSGASLEDRIPVEQALRGPRVVLLVGQAGSGKSVLLRQIAHNVARDKAVQTVPILVNVGAMHLLGGLASVLTNELDRYTAPDSSSVSLDDLLASVPCLILADGLDEILSANDRRKLIADVDDVVRKYPLTKAVVATRPFGLDAIGSPPGWSSFELADLSQDEVARYLAATLSRSDERLVRTLQSSSTLTELAQHPLLLSFIREIFEERGLIPTTRTELLEALIDRSLFPRDGLRRARTIYGPRTVREALIAVAMSRLLRRPVVVSDHLTVEAYEVFDAAGVRSAIASAQDPRFHDVHDIEELISAMVGSGLVREVSTSDMRQTLYAFTHRLILEYFAARGLALDTQGSSTLPAAYVALLDRGETTVVGLAAAMVPDFDHMAALLLSSSEAKSAVAGIQSVLVSLEERDSVVVGQRLIDRMRGVKLTDSEIEAVKLVLPRLQPSARSVLREFVDSVVDR